jgi:DNA-binding HxlR family transcriptional regulator
MTAKQLSRQTAISNETCSYLLGKFAVLQLCVCLNPEAGNSRLYWVTDLGRKLQIQLREEMNLPIKDIGFHSVNWALYGWVCYNHRSVVLRALTESMQPSEIRRRIRHKFPSARISANNVRDIIRLFEKQGIVRKVYVRKKAHPRYELTETGVQLQKLLNCAETGFAI